MSVHDLTRRKKVKKARIDLSSIVEFAGDAIIGMTLEGVMTSWNAAAERVFGYSASEMIGTSVAKLIPPGRPDDTFEILDCIRRGECVTHRETTRIRKDGGEIDLEVAISPIRDTRGRIAGASKIARDIASRKLGEQTMRESEARFRSLFDSNLVAIAFWNPSGFITEANDAYLGIIGYTRAEFEPGKISWRDLTPPEYKELDDRALREAHSNSVSRIYEKEYMRRDGRRTPIVIGLAGLNESRREGLAFALDISERARMQAHMLRSQKLESLSVLAGGIAHDFNNLLMGIIANTSLIIDELPADSPLSKLGENVLAATQQAGRLTSQMLAYSGRGHFAVQSVCLADQVEAISTLMKSSIKKTVKLKLNLPPNLPRIHADAGQVQQVVMNLALNAAESIEMNGIVKISASARGIGEDDHLGSLAGAPLAPGQYVLLEVADTGKGMDESTQAKMFDPFFTTKFVGRGLGLAAVLGIVRGHRGGIAVSSDPGKGTTVQVLFPVHRQANQELRA